jgi:hypothetical protein
MLIHTIATRQIRKPIKSLRLIVLEIFKTRKRLSVPVVPPDIPVDNYILYQTRLFDPSEGVFSDERKKLNENRVAIIRALKSAFGDKFIGGLIADNYSKTHYPDLITRHETARDKYLELVKQCKITVFSKGLRQSTGRRLTEFMSMSRCIVSETLEYQPPFPLIDGVHYLTFNSPSESVDACKKLINDSDLAQQLRNNIYQYYNDYNTPKAIIRNVINTALDIKNKSEKK